MPCHERQSVYGPAFSRRLGYSLGVDIVPRKVCTYDCIYCQLGRTTHKTVERRAYGTAECILEELEQKLRSGVRADYVTISGSGEPTLNSNLGAVVEGIKRLTRIPVAVLTNGSLLCLEDVRQALASADVILPSLDAGYPQLFEYVNRPHPALTFDRVVEGMVRMREGFHGEIWLEVFLLAGVTTVSADLKAIAEVARWIRPHRIQLNTVARPPAESYASAVDRGQLESYREFFEPYAEIIEHRESEAKTGNRAPRTSDILELLARRPCTPVDVANGLDMSMETAEHQLREMARNGSVDVITMKTQRFYVQRGAGYRSIV